MTQFTESLSLVLVLILFLGLVGLFCCLFLSFFFLFFFPGVNLVQLEHEAQQMSNVGLKWSMLTREIVLAPRTSL